MRILVVLILCLLGRPAFADAPVLVDERPTHSHRHAFVVGGLLAVTGAAFGLAAADDMQGAKDAVHARRALKNAENARASAASANVFFALAGVAVIYGVVMELLPDDVAEKAQLRFEF